MSTITQTYIGTLAVETCCNCGIVFGMPEDLQRRLRETHDWFFCPHGHRQHYTGPTEAEKLRNELAREKHWREQEDAAHREFRERFDGDRIAAAGRARWIGKPQRPAFWKGFDAARCGCGPETCPYLTARGGFRRAWFQGYGQDDPGPQKLLGPGAPPVIEADFEVEP